MLVTVNAEVLMVPCVAEVEEDCAEEDSEAGLVMVVLTLRLRVCFFMKNWKNR